MKFVCLECFQTFEIPDDKLPEPGGMLTCPHCGHSHPFTGVRVGTKKRATQAYSSAQVNEVLDKLQKEKVSSKQEIQPKTFEESSQKEGKFIVESPSGLSFEFPNQVLLVKWAEMITNPAPYKVIKTDGTQMSLEEFLKDKTSVERKPSSKRKKSSTGDTDTTGNGEQKKKHKKKHKNISRGEFTFKTVENEPKSRIPTIIVYLLLGLILGAGGLFVAYVYLLK